MNSPFFTVVVPTYNRANFIVQTVNALLNQKFGDFELIVVDDGSTDNTQKLLAHITDPRFHYFFKENGERGAARNYGAALAKGRYVNFFDSDDLPNKNHLELAHQFWQTLKNPEWFHLSYRIITTDGSLIKNRTFSGDLAPNLYRGNCLSCNGVFVRTDIIQSIKFREERILAGSEDFELWLRLSVRFPLPSSPKISHCIVQHPDRSTSVMAYEKLRDRKLFMLKAMLEDDLVSKLPEQKRARLEADVHSYIALHNALMRGPKKLTFQHFIKALRTHNSNLFHLRTVVIVHHLFRPRWMNFG